MGSLQIPQIPFEGNNLYRTFFLTMQNIAGNLRPDPFGDASGRIEITGVLSPQRKYCILSFKTAVICIPISNVMIYARKRSLLIEQQIQANHRIPSR